MHSHHHQWYEKAYAFSILAISFSLFFRAKNRSKETKVWTVGKKDEKKDDKKDEKKAGSIPGTIKFYL